MGFPGRNWRYMISDEVEERMQTTNFMRHHVRDGTAGRPDGANAERSDAVRIHYASKYASSANYWKNAIGMNEGLGPPESAGYETRSSRNSSLATRPCPERR